MKYVLTLLVGLCLSFSTFAAIETNGLSAEQKALLEQQVANFNLENTKNPISNMETVSEQDVERYANIGKNVAGAIGAAAAELNVATNDFMNSPAGALTVFLIVYHFIGADLLTSFLCMILLGVFVVFHFKYVKWIMTDRIERDEKGKIRHIYLEGVSETRSWALCISSIVMAIVYLVLIVNGVFL